MIEKNKKKMKRRGTRVVVEDDFIESNDFRDPGNRKKKEQPVSAVRNSTDEVVIVERTESLRSTLTPDNI